MYIINPYRYTKDAITMITDQSVLTQVGITISFPSGLFSVNWGDGTPNESLTTDVELTHNYSSTGNYTIRVIGDASLVTGLTADNSKIISIPDLKIIGDDGLDLNNNLLTSLDLSKVVSFGTALRAQSNPNLTTIINPTSSEVFIIYFAENCDLTGTLDLSGLSGLGGDFRAHNNGNMTAIINPTSSQTFLRYWLLNNDLSTLDVSGLTGWSGDVRIYANVNLTTITHPTTSGIFSTYFAYSCDLGYIDFTKFTGTNDNIDIRLEGNNMVASEVNHILVDLDNSGWINGTLNIAGNNAAPDGSSGGYDGSTAKTNLISSGWTVTTN